MSGFADRVWIFEEDKGFLKSVELFGRGDGFNGKRGSGGGFVKETRSHIVESRGLTLSYIWWEILLFYVFGCHSI